MSPANMDTGRVQSVMKVLRAFDYIVEQSMLTTGVILGKVASALSLQPSSMSNLLKTLEITTYI